MKLLVGVLYTLLPALLLYTVAALLAGYAPGFTPGGVRAVELAAGAMLLAALALGLQFNRGRVFFALLSLALAGAALLLRAHTQDALAWATLDGTLCLFLPLDLVVFSAIAERGILSRYGAIWFALLAAEVLVTALLLAFHSAAPAMALHVQFAHVAWLAALRISQPGLVVLTLGLLWFNDRLLRRHSGELAAFFFALAAAVPMLYSREPAVLGVFAAASALAFGYTVIQESWSMAYLDELTGLQGRRALEEHMRQLGGRYVIAMVDVDHFKRFNDSYGHDVGDQVLRFVASRLERTGDGGRPFRYGGEEFCLVYGGRGLGEAGPDLEKLRADIESCRFDLRRGGRRSEDGADDDGSRPDMLSITVSIGAAECGDDLKDPWAVMKAADEALYEAKHSGRNRISFNVRTAHVP